MMKVETVYVFKTDFYAPKYKEFDNKHKLKNFLEDFDFMESHKPSNFPTGLPEFTLGVCVKLKIKGVLYKSDVKWGPKFLVGRFVRQDDKGKLFAKVPMDKPGRNLPMIEREYKEVPFKKHSADAVIDLDRMLQVWPVRNKSRTELAKFFNRAAKEKNKIKIR